MTEDEERFLTRWSRRKLDAPNEAAPAPGPPGPAVPAPAAPKPELPPVETLRGLASEYREFLRPGVGDELRQAALKKLFHDPHFNIMDGLDVYIDDYSKPDPIPDAMLRALAHAKGLLFDEKKEEAQAQPERPTIAETPPVAAPAGPTPASSEKKDKV